MSANRTVWDAAKCSLQIIECWWERWCRGSRGRGRGIAVIVLAVMLSAAVWVPAGAVEEAEPPGAEAKGADLEQIETYLNNITSLQSRFLQVSSSGGLAEGDLFVLRPGRMRIDYEPPVPIEIVADGTFLIYHDTDLDQVSYIPLGSTPAGILVEDDIALNGHELTVTDVSSTGGSIRVAMVRTENPAEGSLTLVFDADPLRLRMWRVTDAQGVVTDVSLLNPRFNVPLDKEMFVFRDPRIFGDE